MLFKINNVVPGVNDDQWRCCWWKIFYIPGGDPLTNSITKSLNRTRVRLVRFLQDVMALWFSTSTHCPSHLLECPEASSPLRWFQWWKWSGDSPQVKKESLHEQWILYDNKLTTYGFRDVSKTETSHQFARLNGYFWCQDVAKSSATTTLTFTPLTTRLLNPGKHSITPPLPQKKTGLEEFCSHLGKFNFTWKCQGYK